MEAHAMNSITQNHQDEELLSKKMQVFFRRYQVGRILRAANAYKLRGVCEEKSVNRIFYDVCKC